MKMIETLKEEIKKSSKKSRKRQTNKQKNWKTSMNLLTKANKECQRKNIKQVKEMIQDLTTEIETLKKTQTWEFCKWKAQGSEQQLQTQVSPIE